MIPTVSIHQHQSPIVTEKAGATLGKNNEVVKEGRETKRLVISTNDCFNIAVKVFKDSCWGRFKIGLLKMLGRYVEITGNDVEIGKGERVFVNIKSVTTRLYLTKENVGALAQKENFVQILKQKAAELNKDPVLKCCQQIFADLASVAGTDMELADIESGTIRQIPGKVESAITKAEKVDQNEFHDSSLVTIEVGVKNKLIGGVSQTFKVEAKKVSVGNGNEEYYIQLDKVGRTRSYLIF